jgi:hypothetical protein
MEPIRPPATGITPEAAQALQAQGIPINPHDIVSEDITVEDIENPFPTLGTFTGDGTYPLSDGDVIDAEIVGNAEGVSTPSPDVLTPSKSGSRSRKLSAVKTDTNWEKGEARDASSKPPTLDEWTRFFGNVLLKTACNFYLDFAFRGIDEDALSEREIERLELTDDERKLISTPLAELSNKSKFMRRHGRTIVAGGDALNAFVVLGAWMSRVNRIANKYRPKQPRIRVNGMNGNGSNGQNTATPYTEGSGNGRIPNGYPVYRSSGG